MKVPINYFDPSNGQAMGLEQRIAELFKSDSQIEIPELHKCFSSSQEELLMSEVTMWFEGKKLLTKVKLISQDYSDESTFLNEIENAFKHFVAPIIVTFSTRDSFSKFIEMLKGLNLSKKNAIQCSSFSCKVNGHGLFLNLKRDEVERYGNDFFPMSFRFRAIEDVYNLSLLSLWANPINKPKQETLKEDSPKQKTSRMQASTKKYILSAAVIAGIIAGISTFYNEFFGNSNNIEKGYVDPEAAEYEGVWYENSGPWRFELDAHTMKATVDIVDTHFECEWEISGPSSGVVVGPCGYRNYFQITPSGILYAYDPTSGEKTQMPFRLKHNK